MGMEELINEAILQGCSERAAIATWRIYEDGVDAIPPNCWVSKISCSPFSAYKKEVWRLTELEPIRLLPNYERRGFKDYHLDHILSISEGFRLGLPPETLACISNLRMIPHKHNMVKGTRTVFTDLFGNDQNSPK